MFDFVRKGALTFDTGRNPSAVNKWQRMVLLQSRVFCCVQGKVSALKVCVCGVGRERN